MLWRASLLPAERLSPHHGPLMPRSRTEVSVDYRLAPAHRFPAAWDDAFAAYERVAANEASIQGDPTRQQLVGESVGGNLA
jgi:acetyl esterase/lipase